MSARVRPLAWIAALFLPLTAFGLEPRPVDADIAKIVATTLQHDHYDGRRVDDAVSAAWYDAYLDALDGAKLYFLADDIAGFQPWRDMLDDDLSLPKPTLTPAFAMHDLLVERTRQRIAFAIAFLEKGEFVLDDPSAELVADRENATWAADTAALDDLWRKYLTNEVLRMDLNGEDRETSVARLIRRYKRVLADRESFEPADILQVYLGTLGGIYDPHSVWFKPQAKEDFDIDMRDALTGIGAVLQPEDGYTRVRELIAGGPAEQGGELQAGDRIVAVSQGVGGEPVDVVEMRLDKVVRLIRGPVDTTVVLTVIPADATDTAFTRDISIVRDRVKIQEAAAKGEVHELDGLRIGVIDVPSFYVDHEGAKKGDPTASNTTRDIRRILGEFNGSGVDAVVVDLRRNGGGALDQAIDATGLFIDRGPVVQVKDHRGRVSVYEDEDRGVAWTGPMAVLVSEQSASASEIFAGAIQDYGRGLIVGSETTHGKGTVQNLMGLGRHLRRLGYEGDDVDAGGAMKFTTHLFFRVNGHSTQLEGVHSDVVIPSPWQGLEIKEGDLDHPLPWDSVAAADFKPLPLAVDLDKLRKASATRVSQSMEFAFLEEDLNERERLKDDLTVSLHLPTRQAEKERRDAIAHARSKAREAAGYDPDDPPDAILDEAIHITRDLVKQLRS